MKPQDFGPYLHTQRKLLHITQTELAHRLHVSTAAVSKWERGLCLPELAKLKDLSLLLGITLQELMQCGTEDPVQEEDPVVLSATISGSLTIRQDKSISLGLEFHWS